MNTSNIYVPSWNHSITYTNSDKRTTLSIAVAGSSSAHLTLYSCSARFMLLWLSFFRVCSNQDSVARARARLSSNSFKYIIRQVLMTDETIFNYNKQITSTKSP